LKVLRVKESHTAIITSSASVVCCLQGVKITVS
jgi:hypothetical protein